MQIKSYFHWSSGGLQWHCLSVCVRGDAREDRGMRYRIAMFSYQAVNPWCLNSFVIHATAGFYSRLSCKCVPLYSRIHGLSDGKVTVCDIWLASVSVSCHFYVGNEHLCLCWPAVFGLSRIQLCYSCRHRCFGCCKDFIDRKSWAMLCNVQLWLQL